MIQIESADQFLTDLSERVQALQDMDTPHPLNVGSAVATLKRLFPIRAAAFGFTTL